MSNEDFIDSLSDDSQFIGKQYVDFDKDALRESLREEKQKEENQSEERTKRKEHDAKSEVLGFANTVIHQVLNSSQDSSQFFAKVSINDHFEVLDLDSDDAIMWLKSSYYKQTREQPDNSVYENVLSLIKSVARFNPRIETTSINKRIASDENSCYIDLATPDFKLVKISADEVKIVNHGDNTAYFTRSNNQSRLPEPTWLVENNPLERFLKLVRMEDDSIYPIHLIASFLSHIPTPIFLITGGEGSAKSTRCSLTKMAIDPSGENLQEQLGSWGRNEDDWSTTFNNNYMIGFDNVSRITDEQSDKLCRVTTGDTFSKRKQRTNTEEVRMRYMRKIILNGIGLSLEHSDLLRRTIIYQAKPIPKNERVSLKQVNREFKEIQSELLGFICQTLQKAYKIYPDVSNEITELPDMADFATFGEAISRALGQEPYKFLNDYEARRNNTTELLSENNLLIPFLDYEFSGTDKDELVFQTGTWFVKIDKFATDEGYDKKSRNYPKSSNKMRPYIERSKPVLENSEYTITFEKNLTRTGFSKNSTLMIVKRKKQERLI
jgi:hypothetical protein